MNLTQNNPIIHESFIDTPLGRMIAIANEGALLLLEFTDCRGLEKEIDRLQRQVKTPVKPGSNAIITSIIEELDAYFSGRLKQFKTPFCLMGSPFQHEVWNALCQIPYGETRSYRQQSVHIGRPKAYRAVANANGANQLAILVPCHRIINSNGALGGYGGGIERKQWLIDHESNNVH